MSKETEKREYGFYSKILNKPFDTLAELTEAEDALKRAEEEKKAKADARKAEASKVEEAYKKLNAAKAGYNDSVIAAKKVYLEIVNKAKKEYAEKVAEAEKAVHDADEAYDSALKEFNKAHPEGFHITLRDGDNVTTLSSKSGSFYSDFSDLFDFFFSRF